MRDSEYTGETINLRSYSSEVNRHPLAIVWVNVGKYSVRKEVAVCGSEGTDPDFTDYLVELAKVVRGQESSQEQTPKVNVVTRAKAKEEVAKISS